MNESGKLIVFAYYPQSLKRLQTWCKQKNWNTYYIDGEVNDRQRIVDEFEREQQGVFFISIKAAGVGLNLTSCQYVIIYEPWWNPAVEEQAADRVYRIGQEKEEKAMEAEVKATIEDAQKLMVNSVAAIGRMIDEKDNYTRQHSQRVADYSRLIAENLKSFHPTEKEVDQIYRSALLHDIGKIAIPDAILKKTSRLTDEEYAIMKTHPVWGKKILAGLSFLPQADYGASYHHERYDGKGYPEGIRTDDLPYIVRIISAADALDAMNSNRCYRKQCSRNYIISEFEKGSGTQFDPEVAETVIYLIEEGKIEIPEGENA